MISTIPPKETSGEKPLRIRRGLVESVDLYEVKDNELDTLERGSPADIQLKFAIFLISLACSTLFSLLTATFSSNTVQTVFIIICVCGSMVGSYLLISWRKNRTSMKELCKKIRERIPHDAIVEDESNKAAISSPADAKPK